MAENLNSFLENWRRIHRQTINVIRVAPDEQYDWKTCDSAMTLGGLMNHLWQSEAALAHAVVSGSFPAERPAPLNRTAELIAAFDHSHDEAVARILPLTEAQLAETIAPFGPARALTRRQLLNGMLEHEIHHRGQLYTYLRMLGANVPPLFA
jgi:uncharacterized damage-inducible protein DinB